jgi:hypothetical protein
VFSETLIFGRDVLFVSLFFFTNIKFIVINFEFNIFQSATSRWEDFNESQSKLIIWIGEMEQTLSETPDTKAELGEMKTLIERYKVNFNKSMYFFIFIFIYFF